MNETCPNCGNTILEDTKECPNCGTPYEVSVVDDLNAKFRFMDETSQFQLLFTTFAVMSGISSLLFLSLLIPLPIYFSVLIGIIFDIYNLVYIVAIWVFILITSRYTYRKRGKIFSAEIIIAVLLSPLIGYLQLHALIDNVFGGIYYPRETQAIFFASQIFSLLIIWVIFTLKARDKSAIKAPTYQIYPLKPYISLIGLILNSFLIIIADIINDVVIFRNILILIGGGWLITMIGFGIAAMNCNHSQLHFPPDNTKNLPYTYRNLFLIVVIFSIILLASVLMQNVSNNISSLLYSLNLINPLIVSISSLISWICRLLIISFHLLFIWLLGTYHSKRNVLFHQKIHNFISLYVGFSLISIFSEIFQILFFSGAQISSIELFRNIIGTIYCVGMVFTWIYFNNLLSRYYPQKKILKVLSILLAIINLLIIISSSFSGFLLLDNNPNFIGIIGFSQSITFVLGILQYIFLIALNIIIYKNNGYLIFINSIEKAIKS